MANDTPVEVKNASSQGSTINVTVNRAAGGTDNYTAAPGQAARFKLQTDDTFSATQS
jgi:hypothetical protein